MNASKEWFATWFDTPYYHILYKNRNDEEARAFIYKLVTSLNIPEQALCLDLACGKGRHAKYLNSIGLDVVGLDLSENSIQQAKAYENDRLTFDVHDMREVYTTKKFDVVFNLFTSFGYFDDEAENLKVMNAVHQMLHEKGTFVIDFMNAEKVTASLVAKEEKEIDGIVFNISRSYDGKHIFKNIAFEDEQGQHHSYTERVQALDVKTFERLLTASNFDVQHVYGDYQLNPYVPSTSDRLILVAKKK